MLNRIDKSLHPFSKIRKLVSLSRAKLSRRETFRETFISVPSGIVIGDALISKRWNGNGREGEGGWNTNESGSVLETEFLEFSVPPSPQIYERGGAISLLIPKILASLIAVHCHAVGYVIGETGICFWRGITALISIFPIPYIFMCLFHCGTSA